MARDGGTCIINRGMDKLHGFCSTYSGYGNFDTKIKDGGKNELYGSEIYR